MPPKVIVKKKPVIRNAEGEQYKRLEFSEHIYLNQESYIGSDERKDREAWIYDFETKTPSKQTITVPQGVERCFLEILSNAGDNALRSIREKVIPGKVDITMDATTISVRNEGLPLIIKIHSEEHIWTPEMIFGVLLTSSNYDTSKERVGAGKYGVGAKVTNIFSTEFKVEVGNTRTSTSYTQIWTKNMKQKTEPVITKSYKGPDFVKVSYKIDFERLGYTSKGYPEEAKQLFARYTYDYAETVGIPFTFNGILFEPSFDPKKHAQFYFGDVPMIVHYEWPEGTEVITKKNGYQVAKDPLIRPISRLIVADTPAKNNCISFVNGIVTSEGGVHVNEAIKAVSKPLLDMLNEKLKEENNKAELTWKDVRKHISLMLMCSLPDPVFGGYLKEKLTKPKPKFTIPAKTLLPITKWNLAKEMLAALDVKISKILSSSDGKKKRFLSLEHLKDANDAAGAKAEQCILLGLEGKSAANFGNIVKAILGHDRIGVLPFKGKLINSINNSALKISDNDEIKALKLALGLEEGLNYADKKNFKRLRYGHFMIMADSDDDGKHIIGLIVTFFRVYYPSLLEINYVSFFRSNIIRVIWKGVSYHFYTQVEYDKWIAQNPQALSAQHKYFKGLGSSNPNDVKEEMTHPRYVQLLYEEKRDSEKLDFIFNKARAEERRDWLKYWSYTLEELDIGHLEQITISDFIEKELVFFCKASIVRAIPSCMDGMKRVQRQSLWAAYLVWGRKGKDSNRAKTLNAFSGYVSDKLNYHHGPSSLISAIIGMSQTFVGANNMNYFFPDGMLGSRVEGGKDAASARYPWIKLEWWYHYVYKNEDIPLLEFEIEGGEKVEPTFLLPILPMQLINGARGVGSGNKTFIPKHNPLDVVAWLKARIEDRPLPILTPWYRGFKGEISIVFKKSSKDPEPLRPHRKVNKEEQEDEIEEEKEEEEEDDDNKPAFHMVTKGMFEVDSNRVVRVTELPIGLWTLDYQNWLTKLAQEGKITDFALKGDDNDMVDLRIRGFENPSIKSLRLEKSEKLSSMVLLDERGCPYRYSSAKEIAETFYQKRLPYYARRKQLLLDSKQCEMDKLLAKARYIEAILGNKLDLKASETIILAKLRELDIPVNVRDMKTRGLSQENVMKHRKKIDEIQREYNELEQKTSEQLWYADLVAFEEAWKNKTEVKPKKIPLRKRK